MGLDVAAPADLRQIVRFVVPTNIAEKTRSFLRSRGREQRSEGWVLWAGKATTSSSGPTFVVTTLIVPEQESSGIHSHVDGSEVDRIAKQLEEADIVLGVQVHSHPSRAFHSTVDEEEALVTKLGALSVVVPDFARKPLGDFSHCAVYRLTNDGWLGPLGQATVRGLIVTRDAP